MKPTRATLVSDPYRTGAGRLVANLRVYVTGGYWFGTAPISDEYADLRKGDTVNARHEAGEWRVG